MSMSKMSIELSVKVEDPEVEKLLVFLDAYPRTERYGLLDRAKNWLDLQDSLFYPFSGEAPEVCFSKRNPPHPAEPSDELTVRLPDAACDREAEESLSPKSSDPCPSSV